MLIKIFLIASIALTTSMYAVQTVESPIEMYTEHYPPYNMKVDNKLGGMSIEILEQMLLHMRSKQSLNDVKLTNWSRAYTIALKKKNAMVFSTTRTKQREPLFKWVGPITNVEVGIIALKSKNIKLNDLKDLNNYRIGAVGKDVGEQLLLQNGVNKKNIQYVDGANAINLSFTKMERDRIDMFAYNTTVAFENAKLNGFDSSKYEVIKVLEKNALYFAFNKNTDDTTIEKWQNSLNAIKQNGIYDKIMKKY